MNEGVVIECKKGPLQYMITEKPYALVNDAEMRALSWKEPGFLPLIPNMPYKIVVAFPYLGKKACMPATFQVTLKEGEVQKYLYKTASTVFSSGKIARQ